MAGIKNTGRWVVVLALLALGRAGPARDDEPNKELTEEERGQLEKEAAELGENAYRFESDGRYDAAMDLLVKALAVRQKLYPNGHPDLAMNLSDVGTELFYRGEYGKAERYYHDALDMYRRLYPAEKYPSGHVELAMCLNNLGVLLTERGEYGKAEGYHRDALEMRKRLYPADKYPDGHPDLAMSLANLGLLLDQRGEHGEAEGYTRDGLEMRRRLYPADKYPDGHADLATSLNNLGALLKARGEYTKAEPFYRDALEMYKRLYPTAKYPDGHPDLAGILINLAILLDDRGEYGKAEPYCRAALEMYKRLYPNSKYPDGHPKLARSLKSLGSILDGSGEYGKAERYYHEALEMEKHLYPTDKYPDGHPDLASSLNALGSLQQDRGEYDKAEEYYRQALKMRQRLYPPDKYPEGHPDLATTLNNLGLLLKERGNFAKAEDFSRNALGMNQRLYPADKFPDGHPDLAKSLINLGVVLEARGEYAKAETNYRNGLEMYKRLYPAQEYPNGHPHLAASLINLGLVQEACGEYGKAEPFLRDALEMQKRLYPADKFPDGHPDLAKSLINLGVVLEARGEYAKAERYYRDGLDMDKRLYPADKFPGGHPDLATSLNNLGALLKDRREFGKAEPFLRDGLEMLKHLYPTDKYPDGHSDLARSLNNLGSLQQDRGEYDKAEEYYCQALKMLQRLYSPDKYPDGHPDLAGILDNLGFLFDEKGEYGKAADASGKAVEMNDRLVTALTDNAAETEALNLAASLPGIGWVYLAATAHAGDSEPADLYAPLWGGKGGLARAQERRRRLLRAAAVADAITREKLQKLIETRQDLARLILAPARGGDADRARVLQELTDRKERLEKDLAGVLPASERQTPPYTNLVNHLPDRAAFLDLYHYRDWDAKSHQWAETHYAVFVLRKERPIRRVELADGAAIEKDLAEWRQDITQGLRSDAAGRLRKSVWEPITKALGDGVDTVYVCPDGDLAAMPWSALPGDDSGRVLLEDYTFATVPSGLFLLEQLTRPTPAERDPGVLLAVGGVRYDRDGTPADKAGKPWPALPATDKERAAVVAQARKLAHAPEVAQRFGAEADVMHLLKDLPRARWAHLATHGFFAAKDTQEREHLFLPDDFAFGLTAQGGRLDRRGAAARNPLTLSGLVLAGANQPTDKDTGLLTGEAIAGLDLDGLDLAVLSACHTGLGEHLNGEGVFGLQRAFHIAGTRNVIASLWTVDDESTAALMNLFYYHLWEKNEPPLTALHHAQLELYRNPQGMAALAHGRGAADWDDAVQVVTKPAADPKEPPKRPAAVKDLAAFLLSGAGR